MGPKIYLGNLLRRTRYDGACNTRSRKMQVKSAQQVDLTAKLVIHKSRNGSQERQV
jgi:hypothetical protein